MAEEESAEDEDKAAMHTRLKQLQEQVSSAASGETSGATLIAIKCIQVFQPMARYLLGMA